MQKIRPFERVFCVYALELRTKITLGVLALPQCGSCQRQVLRSKTAGFSTFALQKPDLRSVRAFLRGAYTPSGKVYSPFFVIYPSQSFNTNIILCELKCHIMSYII